MAKIYISLKNEEGSVNHSFLHDLRQVFLGGGCFLVPHDKCFLTFDYQNKKKEKKQKNGDIFHN